MSWEAIDIHRKNARNIKFDILIWGPSRCDKPIYSIREFIKNYLNKTGHSAKFSEELILEGNHSAAPDPIVDEFFHADAAQIIIVLYNSRGTQTEFDRILKHEELIRKTLFIIEKTTWNKLMKSLSKSQWLSIKHNVQIINNYTKDKVHKIIDNYIEQLQFSEYIRNLEIKLLQRG